MKRFIVFKSQGKLRAELIARTLKEQKGFVSEYAKPRQHPKRPGEFCLKFFEEDRALAERFLALSEKARFYSLEEMMADGWFKGGPEASAIITEPAVRSAVQFPPESVRELPEGVTLRDKNKVPAWVWASLAATAVAGVYIAHSVFHLF